MKRTMMIIGMVLMVFVIGAYAVDLADPGLKSDGKIGLKDLSSLIASNNVLIEAQLNTAMTGLSVSNLNGVIVCSNLTVRKTITVPAGSIANASLVGGLTTNLVIGTGLAATTTVTIVNGIVTAAVNTP